MPAKKPLSAAVEALKAEYEELHGHPPGGPQCNLEVWLKQKIASKRKELGIAEEGTPPAPAPEPEPAPKPKPKPTASKKPQLAPVSGATLNALAGSGSDLGFGSEMGLPLKIQEIDTFLKDCSVQFHGDKMEEKHLRTLNFKAAKVKAGTAGQVKRLQAGALESQRALAEAKLPYSALKQTGLGKALLDAIAPFAKQENFSAEVKEAVDSMLDYREASIVAAQQMGTLKQQQAELVGLEEEFKRREERADALAASVAHRLQALQLDMPKQRGRPRAAAEDDCASLGFGDDDEESFSTEAAANAARVSVFGDEMERCSTLTMDED